MDTSPASNKPAATSLTFGVMGWIIYLGKWCFNFSIGLPFTIVTGGVSVIFSMVLDLLPFSLWLIGIVTGHAALGQVKRSGSPGRGKAIWGLVLSYSGIFFIIALIVLLVFLFVTNYGTG